MITIRSQSIVMWCLMTLVTGRGFAAEDRFPPSWAVGDIWRVHVKCQRPNLGMDGTTERRFDESTKTYEIIGEEMVDGRLAFILKLSFGPEDTYTDHYRFRIDKEKRYLIDYRILKKALLPEEHVNDFAPKDSVFGYVAGGDESLLNFVVFPQPNIDEAHVILEPRRRTIYGFKQKITFTPTGATVIGTTTNADGASESFVEQTWKPGDKWPERAVQWQPSENGVMEDVIVETLIP